MKIPDDSYYDWYSVPIITAPLTQLLFEHLPLFYTSLSHLLYNSISFPSAAVLSSDNNSVFSEAWKLKSCCPRQSVLLNVSRLLLVIALLTSILPCPALLCSVLPSSVLFYPLLTYSILPPSTFNRVICFMHLMHSPLYRVLLIHRKASSWIYRCNVKYKSLPYRLCRLGLTITESYQVFIIILYRERCYGKPNKTIMTI